MTFSLVGMCRRTGMFGAAVTTSSINVGARCPYARAGRRRGSHPAPHGRATGGPAGSISSRRGATAGEVVAALSRNDPTIGWRQLAVIDRAGGTAWYHGDRIASIHAAAEGEGCCAIGNIIRTEAVPGAMVETFEGSGRGASRRAPASRARSGARGRRRTQAGQVRRPAGRGRPAVPPRRPQGRARPRAARGASLPLGGLPPPDGGVRHARRRSGPRAVSGGADRRDGALSPADFTKHAARRPSSASRRGARAEGSTTMRGAGDRSHPAGARRLPLVVIEWRQTLPSRTGSP